MSEQTVAEIKAYRPKKGKLIIEEHKVYEFELYTKSDAGRPVDKDTGILLGTGFQPSFSIPNRGSAFNPNTNKFENWRYIEGQDSCFVSEQPELADYDKKDIDTLLGNPENDLEFRDGRMLIRGDQSGKLRLQAMFLSDYFIDNEKPGKQTPMKWKFKLLNPDAVVEEQNDIEDLEYQTRKQARECTVSEMLAVSLLLGINIDDQSPAGLNRIKNAFLSKAKYDPRNPEGLNNFIEIINNPATKIKYIFAQGLAKGLLSTNQQPGKLTWYKLNTPILSLNGKMNPADELTGRAIEKEKIVVNLLAEVEKQLKDIK